MLFLFNVCYKGAIYVHPLELCVISITIFHTFVLSSWTILVLVFDIAVPTT